MKKLAVYVDTHSTEYLRKEENADVSNHRPLVFVNCSHDCLRFKVGEL